MVDDIISASYRHHNKEHVVPLFLSQEQILRIQRASFSQKSAYSQTFFTDFAKSVVEDWQNPFVMRYNLYSSIYHGSKVVGRGLACYTRFCRLSSFQRNIGDEEEKK